MHHPVRDIAVVRDQEQPLSVAIQATDRINPLRNVDEIHHGPPLSLILDGRDEPTRFIEHDEAGALAFERSTVDPDLVPVGIDPRSHFSDDPTVDRDTSLSNHLLRCASAGDPPGCQDTLKALSFLLIVSCFW